GAASSTSAGSKCTGGQCRAERNALTFRRRPMHRVRQAALLTILAIGSLGAEQQQSGQGTPLRRSGGQVEWLYYGGDQAGTKYSPLTDINFTNVQQLQVGRG